jgi:hypothetical protein
MSSRNPKRRTRGSVRNGSAANSRTQCFTNSEPNDFEDAIQGEVMGSDRMRAPRIRIAKFLMRADRMFDKIDQAFEHEPFLTELPPDAAVNRNRFQAYVQAYGEASKLLGQALDLWMLSCGVKRDDDWARIAIEQMRLKHATSLENARSANGTGWWT